MCVYVFLPDFQRQCSSPDLDDLKQEAKLLELLFYIVAAIGFVVMAFNIFLVTLARRAENEDTALRRQLSEWKKKRRKDNIAESTLDTDVDRMPAVEENTTTEGNSENGGKTKGVTLGRGKTDVEKCANTKTSSGVSDTSGNELENEPGAAAETDDNIAHQAKAWYLRTAGVSTKITF